MLAVAKRFRKVQVTVRLHPEHVRKLDDVGERLMRNRSEMIDRAIEFYLRRAANDDVAAVREAIADIRPAK